MFSVSTFAIFDFCKISSFWTRRICLQRCGKVCRHLAPFSAKSILEPKARFGAQNPHFVQFLAQKYILGPKLFFLRPCTKSLLNKGFQEPFWALWEPKAENELILALLAPKVQNDPFLAFCCPKLKKWPHFRILAPKVRKRSPETLCLISLFSQGAKWTPKSGFGNQKRTF